MLSAVDSLPLANYNVHVHVRSNIPLGPHSTTMHVHEHVNAKRSLATYDGGLWLQLVWCDPHLLQSNRQLLLVHAAVVWHHPLAALVHV